MFSGGGLEWAETQLKAGRAPAADEDPDLTGLSCRWGSIRPRQGKILSLIVKPVAGVGQRHFADIATQVTGLLEEAAAVNPTPREGPEGRWPSDSLALQSRVADSGHRRQAPRQNPRNNMPLASKQPAYRQEPWASTFS